MAAVFKGSVMTSKRITLSFKGEMGSGKTRLIEEIKSSLSDKYTFCEVGEHTLFAYRKPLAIDEANIKKVK